MTVSFVIIAALTLAAAAAAMSFRNLVHCALALIATFGGLACLYLQLHAEFVGFVQVLVYVGAVAILLMFAILLTRNSSTAQTTSVTSPSWLPSLAVAIVVAGALVTAIAKSTSLSRPNGPTAEISTQQVGEQLMTRYVLPLEVLALLLTAAMIGAVIIAMKDSKEVK